MVRPLTPSEIPWLCERSGCAWTPQLRALGAVDAGGTLRGAVGFDGWMGNAAQMHIALESPAALRSLLRPAFSFIFGHAGKDVAIGLVPAHNHRAIAFDKHIGFRETYRLKDGWAPGDDVVVLELRKQDCRWFKEKSDG